jgi:hypothetical protein
MDSGSNLVARPSVYREVPLTMAEAGCRRVLPLVGFTTRALGFEP